jgi:hypothetical protein
VRICPDGYYTTDENTCVEKWTIIAYQDAIINNTIYVKQENSFGNKTEPLSNFFDFQNLTSGDVTFFRIPIPATFTSPEIPGYWKFKLDWELENQILAELIWTQTFSTDSDYDHVPIEATPVDVLSFKPRVIHYKDSMSKKLAKGCFEGLYNAYICNYFF